MITYTVTHMYMYMHMHMHMHMHKYSDPLPRTIAKGLQVRRGKGITSHVYSLKSAVAGLSSNPAMAYARIMPSTVSTFACPAASKQS